MQEIEERLRKLELRLASVFSGGVVLFSTALAFFAYEKWIDIPNSVQTEFANQIGKEKLDLLEEAHAKAKTINAALSGVPVGSIIPWHKSFGSDLSLSELWKECDGTEVKDSDSPFNNLSVPNLNGERRFIRGGSTSGTPEAEDWRTIEMHSTRHAGGYTHGPITIPKQGKTKPFFGGFWKAPGSGVTYSFDTSSENRPLNMSVVWIIKIK